MLTREELDRYNTVQQVYTLEDILMAGVAELESRIEQSKQHEEKI